MERGDSELMERISVGDAEAFAVVVDRLKDPLSTISRISSRAANGPRSSLRRPSCVFTGRRRVTATSNGSRRTCFDRDELHDL